MNKILIGILIVFILSGCASQPSPGLLTTPTYLGGKTQPQATIPDQDACRRPVIVPTKPAVIPGYTQLDPSTGLHMTGTVQEIDPVSYRLTISGKVDRPLSLSLDELRCMPRITDRPLLVCRGYFEDSATWSGASLSHILNLAGIQPGASDIILISADGYQGYIPLKVALREDNYLADEWEGQPLPILHGFPLRAVIPTMEGSAWIKWLIAIRID